MWGDFWTCICMWSYLFWPDLMDLEHNVGLYIYSAGTTQTSILHMQHLLHRALISLALVHRVITRWPRVQWGTKTPTRQPATTPHPHPWHTRSITCFFLSFFFLGRAIQMKCELTWRLTVWPLGKSEPQPGRLQPHDSWGSIPRRLQPSHPWLKHRPDLQWLGHYRHPGACQGHISGWRSHQPDRRHPQRDCKPFSYLVFWFPFDCHVKLKIF